MVTQASSPNRGRAVRLARSVLRPSQIVEAVVDLHLRVHVVRRGDPLGHPVDALVGEGPGALVEGAQGAQQAALLGDDVWWRRPECGRW
jgi:hypothetical protein